LVKRQQLFYYNSLTRAKDLCSLLFGCDCQTVSLIKLISSLLKPPDQLNLPSLRGR